MVIFQSNPEWNGRLPVRFSLDAGTALLPEVVKQTKCVSPLSSVRKIHLPPLANCPGNRGTVCVFHDSAVILLWKLSAWGGTPTSGKTLLSELISRQQPSLSISHVCLRTGPGAPEQRHPAKEQQGEQVGGEGRSLKPPNGDWNIVHSCVLKSLCTRKGSAMARQSKHRQAPWKHGHLAGKHGMRYGTNEADNSLNNYIFSLMCYHSNEECGCVRKREKKKASGETSMSNVSHGVT